jgi:peptidoglycan hydrolase CwlO-like protein
MMDLLVEIVAIFKPLSWAGAFGLVASVLGSITTVVIGLVQVMRMWIENRVDGEAERVVTPQPDPKTEQEIEEVQKELADLEQKLAVLQETLEGTVRLQIKNVEGQIVEVKTAIQRLQDRMEALTDSVINYLTRKSARR